MAEKKEWSYKDYTDNQATLNAKTARDEVAASKPSDFTYDDYVESDVVKQAKANLDAQLAQKPNAYQSQWQTAINDTLNKIMNREKFSYDLNGDALYQQYKDQYATQGKLAMMDTMGQAAAATGGYGNSYAQSVGQQAYQGYLQQLNDRVPELYQMALDQYNREGDELYNQYGLMVDRENTDYGRYRDTVSDYNAERDYLTNMYFNESERDYSRYNDAYGKAYNEHRDSVADWQNELNRADAEYWNQKQFGYGQYSDEKNLSYQQHINDRDFDEAVRQFNKQMEQASASSASGGSGSGGKNEPFGGFTSSQFTSAMKEAFADGNQTDAQALVAAAGYTDEAWEIYNLYFGEKLGSNFFGTSSTPKLVGGTPTPFVEVTTK